MLSCEQAVYATIPRRYRDDTATTRESCVFGTYLLRQPVSTTRCPVRCINHSFLTSTI